MDSANASREFLEYVIGQLIESPDQASIAYQRGEGGRHEFLVTLDSEDVGKIIGRNGYTISSIRNLLNASAGRNQESVSLKIVGHEDEKNSRIAAATGFGLISSLGIELSIFSLSYELI
ncbi:MAG: KH domain-containing protein, partial [Verrucomicrobiota bacterium]